MEPYQDAQYVTPHVIWLSPAYKSESVNITSEQEQDCSPSEQLEEVNITLFVEMNAVEVFCQKLWELLL